MLIVTALVVTLIKEKALVGALTGTVILHESSLTALVAAAVFISRYDDLSRTDWSAPAG